MLKWDAGVIVIHETLVLGVALCFTWRRALLNPFRATENAT